VQDRLLLHPVPNLALNLVPSPALSPPQALPDGEVPVVKRSLLGSTNARQARLRSWEDVTLQIQQALSVGTMVSRQRPHVKPLMGTKFVPIARLAHQKQALHLQLHVEGGVAALQVLRLLYTGGAVVAHLQLVLYTGDAVVAHLQLVLYTGDAVVAHLQASLLSVLLCTGGDDAEARAAQYTGVGDVEARVPLHQGGGVSAEVQH